mmetsp:Transcript_72165/g.205058  ORF Transcript_72165/g.205058 Transcript_72165/m.205058 type:complete len:252 (+) Transcript_72165:1780-2535(+)
MTLRWFALMISSMAATAGGKESTSSEKRYTRHSSGTTSMLTPGWAPRSFLALVPPLPSTTPTRSGVPSGTLTVDQPTSSSSRSTWCCASRTCERRPLIVTTAGPPSLGLAFGASSAFPPAFPSAFPSPSLPSAAAPRLPFRGPLPNSPSRPTMTSALLMLMISRNRSLRFERRIWVTCGPFSSTSAEISSLSVKMLFTRSSAALTLGVGPVIATSSFSRFMSIVTPHSSSIASSTAPLVPTTAPRTAAGTA